MSTNDLAIEEQLGQLNDIRANPLKFFEHVKLLDATTNAVIDYEMWPHLVKFIRAIYEHPQVVVLKSKQVGISWTLAAIALLWSYKIGGNVIMISKGELEAAELLRKTRFIYQMLPKHLRLETGQDGVFLLSFKSTHSRIHTLPSTAYAGVGETASLVIWDENEFHPNAKENWAHLKPTIDAGAHGIVVSTVDPTTLDSHFKILWREARAGRNNFYPIFIGRDAVPGRNDAWFQRVARDYYLDWQFRADYPQTEEEALSPITGRTVFDAKILQNLQREAIEPIEIRQGVIHIYHYPRVGVQYIAGADLAEGRGGDYSVLWIEGKDGLQRELCAVIHSNHILPDTFAYMSYELLKEYYSPRVIGGADAFGSRFLEDLVVHGYDRSKIYCSNKKRDKLGYTETAQSKEKDLLELERAIRSGLKIHYKPAIQELFAFQWKESKSGSRAEVAGGSHDDLVIAASKANFGFKQYKVGQSGVKVLFPKTWR